MQKKFGLIFVSRFLLLTKSNKKVAKQWSLDLCKCGQSVWLCDIGIHIICIFQVWDLGSQFRRSTAPWCWIQEINCHLVLDTKWNEARFAYAALPERSFIVCNGIIEHVRSPEDYKVEEADRRMVEELLWKEEICNRNTREGEVEEWTIVLFWESN